METAGHAAAVRYSSQEMFIVGTVRNRCLCIDEAMKGEWEGRRWG